MEVPDLDRVVHDPTRFAILTMLAATYEVELAFLEDCIGLPHPQLASHVSKLGAAGYIVALGRLWRGLQVTSYRITPAGRRALESYRRQLLGAPLDG